MMRIQKISRSALAKINLSYIHNCVKLKSTLKSTKIKSDWGRGRQQRQKWNESQRNVEINDIVLVLDEKTHRCSWPLGRVLEVYTNKKDGLVRSAKIKTTTSVMVRPITKMVLLEQARER